MTGASKSSLCAAASRAGAAAEVAGVVEDANSSSVKQTPTMAKANGAVETVREGSAASHSSSFNARAHTGKSSTGGGESPTSPAVPAGAGRWSRPVREEGNGGAWMVGRRVQIRCEERNTWREGRVQSTDLIDPKIHSVIFDSAADSQPEHVNFGKVTW